MPTPESFFVADVLDARCSHQAHESGTIEIDDEVFTCASTYVYKSIYTVAIVYVVTVFVCVSMCMCVYVCVCVASLLHLNVTIRRSKKAEGFRVHV